jgi:proteasome lid subunit RPN8/RPN11
MKKTKTARIPKTIEEDLRSLNEKELLSNESKKLSPLAKKLIIGFCGLFLILIILSWIYLQYPLFGIIEGQIESRSINNNVLQLNGFKIIFTDSAIRAVEDSYSSNKNVETSMCLKGTLTGQDYFINETYTPVIYDASFRHVTSEPCSNDTLIMFHTHPYKSCVASSTDLNTLKATQTENPDIIMIVMCEQNRFSTYR